MPRIILPGWGVREAIDRYGGALLVLVALALAALPSTASTNDDLRLPPERILAARADSPGPVTFRHETHADPSPGICLKCHPRPFSILGRKSAVTHALMEGGGACGICHDGRASFGASDPDACAVCHDMEGPPPGEGPP